MCEDKKFFELTKKISLRQEYFGGLLFVPLTGEIIQLNRLAYDLLKKISKIKKLKVEFKDLSFWKQLETRKIVTEVLDD